MKKIIVLLMCMVVLTSSTMTAMAAEGSEIMPLMEYISYARAAIYIDDNGVATISCNVYGHQGITTKVTVTAELQRLQNGKWVPLKTYSTTSYTYRVRISQEYSVSPGYSYRVQATVVAYSGALSERQTVTSSIASY